MAVLERRYTRADFDELPEGYPVELIEGCLIREPSPTFRHNRIAARLRFSLLKLCGPDRVPDTPSDVAIDDFNVFQPDIVVLAEFPGESSHCVGVPALAIEVYSPSTRRRDRTVKVRRLLQLGVGEVWLVDPVARTIEVRTSEEGRLVSGDDVAASAAVPGFTVRPSALFAPPCAGGATP